MRYYHGGVTGLRPGQFILPPTETDTVSISDCGAPTDELSQRVAEVHRRDRVYVTTDLDAARVFAAYAPFGNNRRGGDVYEVQPVGDIEPDPDYLADDNASVCCERARVLRIIATGVRRSLVGA